MKVNANVEINDEQRNVLARLIDGKTVKRLATRDEVREYINGCIASLVEETRIADVPETEAPVATTSPRSSTSDLMRIDPEDEEILKDKEPGFVMGWNRWKRRRAK
jgi:hypothetical protein